MRVNYPHYNEQKGYGRGIEGSRDEEEIIESFVII